MENRGMDHHTLLGPQSIAMGPGYVQPPVRLSGHPTAVTLRSYALAAAAGLADDLSQPVADGVEAQFLRAHLEAVARGKASWATTLPAYHANRVRLMSCCSVWGRNLA